MRSILHVDLDAFYASAECLRRPEYHGKPLIVGALPASRGVVCACSYPARAFGIHSGMASSRAQRLCPEAVFLRPDFAYYKHLSARVHSIFARHSQNFEPYALDEAYIELPKGQSEQLKDEEQLEAATLEAQQILDEILSEVGLSASVGVSYNKFLAKLGSGYRKPSGLSLITPASAVDFLSHLEIHKFHGLGKVRAKALKAQGYKYGRDLQALCQDELLALLGSYGNFLYFALQGHDERPVCSTRSQAKSYGLERTLPHDVVLDAQNPLLHQLLFDFCQQLLSQLEQQQLHAMTLTVKIRSSKFQTYSRSCSWKQSSIDENFARQEALSALSYLCSKLQREANEGTSVKIRLLGLSFSRLHKKKAELTLF